MGSFWDWVNPVTSAKKVGNAVVDAVGSVAQNVAGQVDTFAKKTLETTLASGAAIRQLSKPQGDPSLGDPPTVNYVPLAIGGAAAAGLLLWALMGRKKKEAVHA